LRLSAAGLAGSAAHPVSLEPENNAGASAPSISIATNRDFPIREATEQRRHPCTARRRPVVCARKSAPAPAGQGERQECLRVRTKKAAPSRSAAGKGASLKHPAHFPRSRSSPIWAKTIGLVRTANRAGRRQAAPISA